MLAKGQKVRIRADLQVGVIRYEEIEDDFFVEPGMAKLVNKVVTISEVVPFKYVNNKSVYFYRIAEDSGHNAWLECHFIPVDMRNIYLLVLKNKKFFIIRKEDLEDVTFFENFDTLSEDVKTNCTFL